MSNIIPFLLNQVSEASKLAAEEVSPLQRMENVRAEIQAVFAGLTAMQDKLANSQISVASAPKQATTHKLGAQG